MFTRTSIFVNLTLPRSDVQKLRLVSPIEMYRIISDPNDEPPLRAAFRIFIQGGRNGLPQNVGGADGYPCAF